MNPLLALTFIASISEVLSVGKVLVLSFDGFRKDYIKKKTMPILWEYYSNFAAPSYVKSIFPTKTMVTHHSISTGVYPDQHGVYANQMFDENGGVKNYSSNYFNDLNKDIIPIWIENQKKGGKSGLMMWPGGEFDYQSTKATLYQAYDESLEWDQRIKTIIDWAHDEGCNLMMAYFEDNPFYKKDSMDDHIENHIKNVDNTFNTIFSNLISDWNVVILSDHGTSQVPGSNVIIIDTLGIDETLQKIVSGPLVFIKVSDAGMRTDLFTTLKKEGDNSTKFKAYQKDTFKEDWHIKSLEALNDVILLVAEPTYTFMTNNKFEELLNANEISASEFMTIENGYDNDVNDMNGMFVAYGPNFKGSKFLNSPIKLIDVYPLLKKLLGLLDAASTVQNMTTLSPEMKNMWTDVIVTKEN